MATTPATPQKTPWHLWVLGVLYLLWSCVGAMDFTLTQTHTTGYTKAFTAGQLAYVYGFPLWVVIAWGVATWGGVLGSLLLLLRRRLAVCVFLLAFLGMILATIYGFGLSDGMKVMGGAKGLAFNCLIVIAGILLWLYARAMRRRGVLR